ITTPPAVETLRECLTPNIGIRTCVSAQFATSNRIPSISFPKIRQTGNAGFQSNRSTDVLLVSTAAISYPAERSVRNTCSESAAHSHGTLFSTPSAVLL